MEAVVEGPERGLVPPRFRGESRPANQHAEEEVVHPGLIAADKRRAVAVPRGTALAELCQVAGAAGGDRNLAGLVVGETLRVTGT